MMPADSPTSSMVTDAPDGAPAIGSVSELIGLWPSVSVFATDIGVGYEAAKAMKRRETIKSEYFVAVVAAATRRQLAGVTYELLAELHSRSPSDLAEARAS